MQTMDFNILGLLNDFIPIISGIGIGWFSKSGRIKEKADAYKKMGEAYQYRIDTLHEDVKTLNNIIKENQERLAELNHALNEKTEQIRNLTDKLYKSEQEVNRVQDLLNDEKDLVNALTNEHLRIENNLQLELAKKKCEDIKCPFRKPPTPDTPPIPNMTKEEYHAQRTKINLTKQ